MVEDRCGAGHDAESGDYDTEQKADDLAIANYQSTWSASYAAAIQAFDQANPSPWADEAAALAAARATEAASLATAQQTESDAEADVEEQDETSQTDAQTQFQESQVIDEHDLELKQATSADNEVGSDVQALETGASTNPNFTTLPAELTPPATPAAPPVSSGGYYDAYATIDPGTAWVAPAVDPAAAGNFGSWLGWGGATAAGGNAGVESPNTSGGTGGALADVAFDVLGLLQTEVHAIDPAVLADDAAPGSDGSKSLPLMDVTPPALTPPAPERPRIAVKRPSVIGQPRHP